MQLSDRLQPYWPVIAASLLFFLLGLWWRIWASRAMERSPKSYEWVRRYRTGGFPFRPKLMGSPKLRPRALALVLLLAGALFCGALANRAMIRTGSPEGLFAGYAWILPLGLAVLGAGAIYCLLVLLFDSLWVSLPGALLYAAAAVRSPGECGLIALSLLLLLLYLRRDKAALSSELLYLGALLALAPALALTPACFWLLPCCVPVHWYKLNHQLRLGRFYGLKLLLFPLVSLLTLALTVSLGALLHPVLAGEPDFTRFDLTELLPALQALGREALDCFRWPVWEDAADLLVDAPLLGYGIWGCCSAWILAWKRRDARGYFVLTALAVTVLLWLVCWHVLPLPGLALVTACILRDADLGKKRIIPVLMTLAGIGWYCFIHIAAWAVPLSGAIQNRLI